MMSNRASARPHILMGIRQKSRQVAIKKCFDRNPQDWVLSCVDSLDDCVSVLLRNRIHAAIFDRQLLPSHPRNWLDCHLPKNCPVSILSDGPVLATPKSPIANHDCSKGFEELPETIRRQIAPSGGQTLPRKVLVVEPNTHLRVAIFQQLREFGFSVLTCDTVKAAIEYCRMPNPPLALVILHVSIEKGEQARVLRCFSALSRVPQLLVISDREPEMEAQVYLGQGNREMVRPLFIEPTLDDILLNLHVEDGLMETTRNGANSYS